MERRLVDMHKDHPRPAGARRGLILLGAAALGFLVVSGWLIHHYAAEIFLDPESLRALVSGYGTRAPLAMIALQAAQVIVAPIPGHLLTVVSGLAFGIWWGTLYSAFGVGLGSLIVLVLSRLVGRPLVRRLVPPEAMGRVDRWAARGGPIFFFVFFLLPFMPDDLACFAVGLSALPLLPMFGLIVLARLPGHFVSAWIGATATHLPWWGWVAIVGFAAFATALLWRHRAAIETWMLQRIESLS